VWDAESDWKAITGEEDPNEQIKQPDLRRPKWEGSFQPIPQSRFYDLDGKFFADKAGTPFSPPPNIPIYVDVETITRYEASMNRANDRIYLNATNTDNWNGALPGEAFVDDISYQEIFEFGMYWFLRTYRVFVNPRISIPSGQAITDLGGTVYYGGYDPTYILNAGPRKLKLDTVLGKKVAVPIKIGNVTDGQPHPLDENGELIPRDEETGEFTQAIVYLQFRTVNKRAFSPLNLVPPWF
jgi:hypothetical protein